MQPLCPLCLCGEQSPKKTITTETVEISEAAQRTLRLGQHQKGSRTDEFAKSRINS